MDSKRLGIAFGWGMVATVVMSIPMLIATATGVAPMSAGLYIVYYKAASRRAAPQVPL
jgi:hypothetical protein